MPGPILSQAQKLREGLIQRGKEAIESPRKMIENLKQMKDPMVKIEKDYVFTRADGMKVCLPNLFEGKSQLIVYHCKASPEAMKMATKNSSTMMADMAKLECKFTAMCAVSMEPMETVESCKQQTGWPMPWYSSAGSDFDKEMQAVMQPVKSKAEMMLKGMDPAAEASKGGMSIFCMDKNGMVYHAGSTSGVDLTWVMDISKLIDMGPLRK